MKGCLVVILVAIVAFGISFFAITNLALSPPDKISRIIPAMKQDSYTPKTAMPNTPSYNYSDKYSDNSTGNVSPGSNVKKSESATARVFKKLYTEAEINSIVQSEVYGRTPPEFGNAIKGVSVQLLDGRILIYTNINTDYLPKEILKQIPVLSYAKSLYFSSEVGVSVLNSKPSISIYNFQVGRLNLPVGMLDSSLNRQLIEQIVFNYLSQNNVKLEKISIANKQIVIEGKY